MKRIMLDILLSIFIGVSFSLLSLIVGRLLYNIDNSISIFELELIDFGIKKLSFLIKMTLFVSSLYFILFFYGRSLKQQDNVPPRQRASPNACLYLSKNKQNEVVNENSKNLNQTRLMFQARVRKRAPAWGKIMKNKFLSIFIMIIFGSFLLSISMFLIARILYNFENNIALFNIHFLDYFNDGFIERLKMIFMHAFIFFLSILFFYRK